MRYYKLLIIIAICSIACSTPKEDSFASLMISDDVSYTSTISIELLKTARSSQQVDSGLVAVVDEALELLNNMENRIIEKSGGYGDGWTGTYSTLKNPNYMGSYGLFQEEFPYSVVKLVINNVPEYTASLGLNESAILNDPTDDPIYQANPEELAKFDKINWIDYFEGLTLVEALSRVNIIKTRVIQIELKYYLSGQ